MAAFKAPTREAPAATAEIRGGCSIGVEILDNDVVHETFPAALQAKFQSIAGRDAVAQFDFAGVGNRRPGALGRIIAVAPIVSEPVVSPGVNQFETAAAACGPLAPSPTGAVGDF